MLLGWTEFVVKKSVDTASRLRKKPAAELPTSNNPEFNWIINKNIHKPTPPIKVRGSGTLPDI